jgi:hypothetical protein
VAQAIVWIRYGSFAAGDEAFALALSFYLPGTPFCGHAHGADFETPSHEENDMGTHNPTGQLDPLGTCPPDRGRRLGLRHGLVLVLALSAPGIAMSGEIDPSMLPQPSEDLTCAETPFGKRMSLGEDVEMIDLQEYVPGFFDPFHEWILPEDPELPGAPALVSSLDTDWTYFNENGLAGGELLKAVRADLNGDGFDELVVATKVLGDDSVGNVRIGVYKREPFIASIPITLIDTWETIMRLSEFDMAVGNLDGSADGKEELAIMVRRGGAPPIQTSLVVFVLTGNAEGGIAEENNTAAGQWSWAAPPTVIGQSAIAAGDMLLDGRAQMVVVAEGEPFAINGNSRTLNYHLLEFQPQSPALPIESGAVQIGSRSFSTLIGNAFRTGRSGIAHTIDSNGITALVADAADVAGDAAFEFVTHYEFNENQTYTLAQRLQHFQVIRDEGDAIVDIELAVREAPGVDYDDSKLIRQNSGTRGDWDVLVANVDTELKDEIVVASNDATQSLPRIRVDVYKAAFDLTADFTWYASGDQVQFREQSVGIGRGPFTSGSPARWEFDGEPALDTVNPVYTFATGTHAATLNITQDVGGSPVTASRTYDITVNDGLNSGGGLESSNYMFQMLRDPSYSAYHEPGNGRAFSPISVAAGDMDRDGQVEIMSLARMGTDNSSATGRLRSVWRVEFDGVEQAYALEGRHLFTPNTTTFPNAALRALEVVAVDFDGDSIEAQIADANCRRVEEAQVRHLIWVPPYFRELQTEGEKSSWIGQSGESGSSVESQFGTFTSHDFSGYIGLQLGSDAIGVEASARATAGYNLQKARGGLVGSENSRELDESFTQSQAEALMVVESNTFECYTYNVAQATVGVDPDSLVRFCEIIESEGDPPRPVSTIEGFDPEYWEEVFPQTWAEGSEGHAPPAWAPMHRDWTNLALFKTASSNVASMTAAELQHITDGRYTTAGESLSANQPYVEIDLGSVQPIAGITIFPKYEELASDLTGFRVFISDEPMPVSGLPGGAGVREFAPESIDDAVFDRWNIRTRYWDASEPGVVLGAMMQARYIRLQHPGQGRLSVGEIQVFGDTHAEPPQYPEEVCDPVSRDGLFLAKVWDASSGHFRAIEMRGDMLWTGTAPDDDDNDGVISDPSWPADGPWLDTCINNVTLNQPTDHNFEIGTARLIGGTSSYSWNLHTGARNSVGDVTSFERSTRVGAEFDLTVGAFAAMVSGAAFEVASGVTEEHQNVSYWGTGLDLGGEMTGFDDGNLTPICSYNARPYAYARTERSNTGYEHAIYAVDYVVNEGVGDWSRADMPPECVPGQEPVDRIFQGSFEPLPPPR